MPLCKKCACVNPSAFYPYLQGECKDCTRSRVRNNRDKNIDYYRAFDRSRGDQPHRKEAMLAKTKRLRALGYGNAHNAVTRAIKTGALIRPSTCARCPANERIQAHHDDHSKLLAVMWLCPICHAARHKELGRLRTMDTLYGEHPVVTDQRVPTNIGMLT